MNDSTSISPLRPGEASAAMLAVPLLKAAACHNGMATFAQAEGEQ